MTGFARQILVLVLALLGLFSAQCSKDSVAEEKLTLVEIQLQPEYDSSRLDIFHGNAEIFVDGDLVSNTLSVGEPVYLHLPQGRRSLKVAMSGYDVEEKIVRILDTEEQEFLFEPKLSK